MNKLNVSVVISIIVMIFSIGGSFAVVSQKANEVDKVKAKTEAVSDKVIALEIKIDSIKENMKEQRDDIKAILRAVKQ